MCRLVTLSMTQVYTALLDCIPLQPKHTLHITQDPKQFDTTGLQNYSPRLSSNQLHDATACICIARLALNVAQLLSGVPAAQLHDATAYNCNACLALVVVQLLYVVSGALYM